MSLPAQARERTSNIVPQEEAQKNFLDDTKGWADCIRIAKIQPQIAKIQPE